jgi:hypothetical protein
MRHHLFASHNGLADPTKNEPWSDSQNAAEERVIAQSRFDRSAIS